LLHARIKSIKRIVVIESLFLVYSNECLAQCRVFFVMHEKNNLLEQCRVQLKIK